MGNCNSADWGQTLNPDDYTPPNSDTSEPNSPIKKKMSTLKLLYDYFLLTKPLHRNYVLCSILDDDPKAFLAEIESNKGTCIL